MGLLALLAGGAGYMIRQRAGLSFHQEGKRPRRFEVIRAMVPMRDGVKLETVIFVPKEKREPLPFLFQRTPYGIPQSDDDEPGALGHGKDELIADGYIWVQQNLRGRFKSEGTFEMLRPPREDRNDPRATDETTDAYDTIEWLLHNVPGHNGRVGMYGGSYDGWTQVMALLEPHPALRAVHEAASPSDMFLNDDDHHNGAFRFGYSFEFVAMMESSKNELFHFEFDRRDTYDFFLDLGALSHVDERYFHGQKPTWTNYVEHPNRDAFWKRMAVGTHLERTTVPNFNIAGFWDQEDFVGPLDIYARLEKNDSAHINYVMVGPWNHGSWGDGGRKLGAIDFGRDTSVDYRAARRQWFAHWLHDGPLDLAEATVFESGSNQWKKFDRFPPESGITSRKLYLRAGGKLSFDAPAEGEAEGFDTYVSDPANPVPYRHRPIGATFSDPEHPWRTWLLEDQRFVDHRPDVLTWQTDVLDRDIVVNGDIVAELFASTSGTDSDWVVKLIDVYPEDASWAKNADAGTPDMRGYQFMIANDVFRGRYRKDFEHPEPIPADTVVPYTIDLHPHAHAFLRGHRIMVQVQSSLFPLIDRNPQKYVDNIYKAQDSDFTKATQRVFRSRGAPSCIVLPLAE
ncbi:CocE/NonD family hydrolase [Pendulispora albinea]|uniref:CocE/NonD family hydrolase n=1 Tax=Pendulispora albinea TaxID=2741071 RepID=A0ABZ2LY09_9BACT